jgi:3-methyladenine DNA glycosylase AlkD
VRASRANLERSRRVVRRLRASGRRANVAGMRRFGITSRRMVGVGTVELRRLARELGPDHGLARQLWDSGIFEARLLACLVDEPDRVTEPQLERCVGQLDSWALCDGWCQDLVAKTRFAWAKAFDWSGRTEEFARRAAFAVLAKLAVHDRSAPDARFLRFLRVIERASSDERPYVRKAVNWALRQIGKRNAPLRRAAIATARRIRRQGSSPARWIASDALRELRSEAVRRRTVRSRLPI